MGVRGVGSERWEGIDGGLESFGVWERRDEVPGLMSAGGAREALDDGGEVAWGGRWEEPEVGWSRQKDSYVLDADSVLEKRSKSPPRCGWVIGLLDCLCMAIILARGDAATFRRPGNVDVDDAGDPVRDARDSTSSMVLDCQPLLTLTIAYERRVRSSEES